jgi:ATP-binding cassette subfamily B multidrug efflux pump
MKKLLSLASFVKPYWKQSVAALALLVSVVAMDLAIPKLIQRIIDDGIAANNLKLIINTTLIMLTLSITSAVFSVGMNYFSVYAGEGVARDLRDALFSKIQQFSYGNLDRMVTGQLIVRLTSDISMIQRITRMLLRIGTRAPLLMIGSLVLMVSTNPTLALYILPLLLLTGGLIVFFVSRMGSRYMVVQEKLDLLNTVLQENIAGIRVVKAFVQDKFESDRFKESNQNYTNRSVEVMQLMALMSPTVLGLINIGIVLIIWIGGGQVISGSFSLGEIVAFTNYLLTTMSPLMILVMISQVVASGSASAERICQVLDEEIEIQDAPDTKEFPSDLKARVEFENVKFFYNGHQQEVVLDGVTFTAEPGEVVALLGATGAGKTTLVNLIPRFYDISEGAVRIDGIDIRQLKQEDVISLVGLVPQETVLFSGSVRDNICYGKPGASDQEMVAAARAAQAHDFIMELPDQYETRVNQRGVNLSGGQKQRIAIARAILPQPKILILDDSTSSVDVETEREIQAALEGVMEGKTSFVVAQRISTVLNADKILVLDKGRIVAEGTHKELIESSSIYKEIYDSQLGAGLEIDGLQGEDHG